MRLPTMQSAVYLLVNIAEHFYRTGFVWQSIYLCEHSTAVQATCDLVSQQFARVGQSDLYGGQVKLSGALIPPI